MLSGPTQGLVSVLFLMGLVSGQQTTVQGGVLDALSSSFSTVVPQKTSGTFLDTHAYAGVPKLGLKADGLLKYNRHNHFTLTHLPVDAIGGWSLTQAAFSADVEVSPNGFPAWRVTSTNGGTSGATACSMSSAMAPSGVKYRILAKKGSGAQHFNAFGIYQTGAISTDIYYITVNYDTGVVTENPGWAANGETSMTALPGGWWEIIITIYPGVLTAGASAIAYVGATGNVNPLGAFTIFSEPSFTTGPHLLGFLENRSATRRVDEPTVFSDTGIRLGIAEETAATNLFSWSNNFSNAYWTKQPALTSNVGPSPDGTNNATKLTPGGTSQTWALWAPNMSSTSLSAQGIWVKADGYDKVCLREHGLAGNTVLFTLTGNGTQVVSHGSNIAGKIEKFPNGWYRIQIRCTNTGTQGFALYIVNAGYTSGDPAGYLWSGNGTSGVLIYEAQRENNVSELSSQIPTSAASIQRIADNIRHIIGPEWNAVEGAAVGEVIPRSAEGLKIVFQFDDGTDNNREVAYIDASGNTLVRSDLAGSNRAPSGSLGSATIDNLNRIAFAWKAADYAASANGGVAATSTTAGALPTTHQVRYAYGTLSLGNQTLVRLRYYSYRVANADLVTLSGGGDPGVPANIDFNYATGEYSYTPFNAGVSTVYSEATLISSGVMQFLGTPSLKYVFGANKRFNPISAGVLATEFDKDGVPLGWFHTEPQRTCTVKKSADLGNASWWGSVGGYSPTTRISCLQGQNAVELTGIGNGSQAITQLAGTPGAVPVSMSVIIENVNATVSHLGIYNNTSPSWIGLAALDWSNLTVSTSGGTITNATVRDLGIGPNGGRLVRVSFTVTPPAATVIAAYIYWAGIPAHSLKAILHHVGVEIGSYASSPIVTDTSDLQRNVDRLQWNLGPWFDPARYITVCRFNAPRSSLFNGANPSVVFGLNSDSGTTTYAFVYGGSRLDWAEQNAGVSGALGNDGSDSFQRTIQVGLGYAPSRCMASEGGATQNMTGTPSPVQPRMTKVGLGTWPNAGGGAYPGEGSIYIQRLAILPVLPTQALVNQYTGNI